MKSRMRVLLSLTMLALVAALCVAPATALGVSTKLADFDSWYAKAKTEAFKADHVIGPGGDIGDTGNTPYVVVKPGETIGVYPDADYNISIAASGAYGTINYSIYQFDKPVADYSYLPRSAKPKAVLTKVKTATVAIPYDNVGEIDHWRDGSNLKSFTYTSLYRNDTGFAILFRYDKLGTARTDEDGMAFIKSNSSYYVQGNLTKRDGISLFFLEPSYQINIRAAEYDNGEKGTIATNQLYWNHTTTTVPSAMPKTYVYASTEAKTYKLLHPIVKGHTFQNWYGKFDDDGYMENHPLGAPLVFHTGDTYTSYKDRGLYISRSAESSDYKLNAVLCQNKGFLSYIWAADVQMNAYFEKSANSHTIGFNGNGGTVKGGNYYLCEDAYFNLDVSTIVPTRSGYTFKGWCTNKSKPAATMVTGSGRGDNVYGTTASNNHSELYAVWEASSSSVTPVTTAVSLSKAAIAAIANQTWTGKAVTPKPKITYNGKTLKEGTDYTLSYKNNVNAGTATVVATGKGAYTGTKSATFKIVKATPTQVTWTRLWGNGSLDTMRAIVRDSSGWKDGCGGTVVVATNAGHYDALSAAGVAGIEGAPVLMTDPKTLSAQTRAELVRMKPAKVIVAGGPAAVSDAVKAQIRAATGVEPLRLYGGDARATANALNLAYRSRWTTGTAIVATQKTYHDALSAAPVAYARRIPVFLVRDAGTIDDATIAAMRACGVKRTVAIGGEKVVGAKVEARLKAAGMPVARRCGGADARSTSRIVAEWGLSQGMSADRMGVARCSGDPSYAFRDALCGAALCGRNNAVLVLADDAGRAQGVAFAKANKAKITRGYVFGGTSAVGKATFDAFVAATK